MSTELAAVQMGFPADAAFALEETCIRFGIDTTLRKAHFLAQVAHESGAGRWRTELWGPTPAQLRYEGRKDLGNTEPGDGYRYRGRGFIQLTGRSNVAEFSHDLFGDDRAVTNPEMVAKLPYAAWAAGWYWHKRGINRLADKDDLVLVTRAGNGGLNGLADRARYLDMAKRLFAAMQQKGAGDGHPDREGV